MILYLLLSVYAAQEAAADEIMAKSISVPDQKNSHWDQSNRGGSRQGRPNGRISPPLTKC